MLNPSKLRHLFRSPSLDISTLYTTAHSTPATNAGLPHPPTTNFLLSFCSVTNRPSISSYHSPLPSSTPPAFSSSADSLSVLRSDAECLLAKRADLLYFVLFIPVDLISSVSRSTISNFSIFLGSLDTLLCNLMALCSGLALFRRMTSTLATES